MWRLMISCTEPAQRADRAEETVRVSCHAEGEDGRHHAYTSKGRQQSLTTRSLACSRLVHPRAQPCSASTHAVPLQLCALTTIHDALFRITRMLRDEQAYILRDEQAYIATPEQT